MPQLPSVNLTVKDGGLGIIQNSATNVIAHIGPCSESPASGELLVRTISSLQDVRDLLGYGPLAEAVAHYITVAGPSCYAVAAVAQPGSVGSVHPGDDNAAATGAQVTITGTPLDSYDVLVTIVKGGVVGTATFKYSLDGGVTISPEIVTASTYAIAERDGTETGVTLGFVGSRATAKSATGPFDLRGVTQAGAFGVTFNTGGDQTFNVNAGPAVATGGAGTFPIASGKTLTFKDSEHGFIQTYTTSGSLADNAALIADINLAVGSAFIFGIRAMNNGGHCDLKSTALGTDAYLEIVGGDGMTAMGQTAAVNRGTGNVHNLAAVTSDEIAGTDLIVGICTPVTNGTVASVDGQVWFTTATVGSTGTAQVTDTVTGSTEMGGDFASHAVKSGTGSYVVGDTFEAQCTPPSCLSSDVTDALDALEEANTGFDVVCIHANPADPDTQFDMARAVDNKLIEYRSDDFVYAEAIVDGPTQPNIDADDFADAFDTQALLWTCATGKTVTLTSSLTGRSDTRSVGFPVAARLGVNPPSQDISAVADGALPSVTAAETNQAAAMDEARIIGARVVQGYAGKFISDSPTLNAPGSDYTYLQNALVVNRACRAAYIQMANRLSGKVPVKADGSGQVDPEWASKTEAAVNGVLRTVLAGNVVAVGIAVDRTNNVLSTNTINVIVSVVPYAYAKQINVQIGLSASL